MWSITAISCNFWVFLLYEARFLNCLAGWPNLLEDFLDSSLGHYLYWGLFRVKDRYTFRPFQWDPYLGRTDMRVMILWKSCHTTVYFMDVGQSERGQTSDLCLVRKKLLSEEYKRVLATVCGTTVKLRMLKNRLSICEFLSTQA